MNPVDVFRGRLATHPISSTKRRVYKVLFVALFLSPFVFLAVHDCVHTYDSITESTINRRQAFVRLTAITLQGKLDNVKNIGVALADNTQIKTLISAGRWQEAVTHLKNITSDFQDIDRIGLFDSSGRTQAVFPYKARALGLLRDNRDWYKGLMRTKAPYISEVYTGADDPTRRVIACAIPINDNRRLIGILVLQIPIKNLLIWAEQVNIGPEGTVYFVDQYGHRIGHVAHLGNDLANHEPIQRVLRGERGTITVYTNSTPSGLLASYEPINNGWGVIVEQPLSRAFVRRTEIIQSVIGFYLMLMLAAGLIAYALLMLIRTLQRNREELREFIDHMSTMAAKVTVDGKIILANKPAELASGLSREELEKTSFLEGQWWAYDPEVQARVIKNFERAAQGEIVESNERIMAAGVGPLQINFSLTPVKHPDGSVHYLVAEGRDITPMKKTEEALAYAQHVGRLGSWEWNMVSHKMSWSAEFQRVLNMKTNSASMSWDEFQTLRPDEAYFLLDMLKKFIDVREPFSANRSVQMPDGSTRWLQWSGEAFFDADNKLIRMSGTVQDITSLKTAEEQRWQLIEEQRKRIDVEKSQQRAQFLAQAALLLSSTLDYEQTLERLAKLLTIRFSDWCAIYLLNDDGTLHRVLATQEGISKAQNDLSSKEQVLAWEKANELLIQTIKTEKPQHVATVTDEFRSSFKNDPIHMVMAEYFGFESVMFLPMIVRGRALGAIEFVIGKSKKNYDRDDVSLAEELTHYASVAVENARLYRQAVMAQERANTLASIVANSEDAIVGENLSGVIVSWNTSAQKMYGYTAQEIIGLPVSALAPPDKKEEVRRVLERLKRGELVEHFETVRRCKNGGLIDVSLMVSPIKNEKGELVGVSSSARDISEKKKYEQGLAKARDLALESARMKTEFVANVSHEIRTPMNGIIGMMGLMLNSKLTPQQRDYAETVRNSCDSLLAIINDILDFSKIEASQMRLEMQDFDLQSVIDNTLEFLAPRAHFKDLELLSMVSHDTPIFLRGDSGRLSQIIMNLVSNAIKFTDTGEVMVRVAKQNETKDHVTIVVSVADTGVGIPTERQVHLFQPFSQADNSVSRKYGGTGLGLALCKRFVELMGGEIGLQSDPGTGSTFWFQVTLEKQRGLPAAIQKSADFSDLRVLVIGGKDHVADVVIHHLQPWRFKGVDKVNSFEQARTRLKAAHKEPYSVVIFDRNVSGQDPLVFARIIASSSEFPAPRTVLLTTMDQPIDSHLLREAGIGICLTKPFKTTSLLASLRPQTVVPVKKERAKAQQTEGTSPRHQRPHLLVVEDNSINQKVMSLQLAQLGYSADTVANGLEAIKAWEQIPYDLILMDCQMPEMDGYTATEAIRRREAEGKHIPIIAMTAHVMVGDREKCIKAGMDDYIPKPIKTENLQAMLTKWHPLAEDDSEVEPENDDSLDPLKDPVFVRKISALFLKETPAYLHAMKKALQEKDAAELRAAAHSVAGSCCIVGTKELKVLCQTVEGKAEAGLIKEVPPLLKKIEAEFKVVEKLLAAKPGRKHHEDTYRG